MRNKRSAASEGDPALLPPQPSDEVPVSRSSRVER